ncbi:MAG: hypothetical protein GC156_00085 [Actinomycetales bacterium]|nr:hypothetical protein [Actinomycetales bacterium]
MRTLVIHQAQANVVHVTDGDEVHGDVMTYEGDISGPDGLEGVIVGINNSARRHGETHWDRVGMATFSFAGDDSICVSGVLRYESNQQYSHAGSRHVSAVVGGTGQFIGVRGELASVRNDDGSFTHTFTLL